MAALALLALSISAALGYAALHVMPCSWFGSSFEGACGYGALYATVAGALLLSLILFVTFTVVYLRRERAGSASASVSAAAASGQRTLPAQQHSRWWRISFWVVVCAYGYNFLMLAAWPSGHFFGIGMLPLLPQLVLIPLLLVHCACVFLVARALLKGQEIIWMLVSGITAPFGTIAVYLYMRHLMNISQRATSQRGGAA